MPCFLFTYHAYGSWLPDRDEGFVRRGRGLQLKDLKRAGLYRNAMSYSGVRFDETIQKLIIEEVLSASRFQDFRPHYVATEDTHIHVLLSWTVNRTKELVSAGLKESITRRLNRSLGTTYVACEGGQSKSG